MYLSSFHLPLGIKKVPAATMQQGRFTVVPPSLRSIQKTPLHS